MSQWIDTLTAWLAAHPQWLGLAILLVSCLECLAIAGLVVPGTVMLFALAVMAGSGSLSLWQTLLLAYAGGLAGDLLSYWLGRRFHGNIRRLPILRKHPEWLGSAELYFLRYGAVSLLIGRFIGPLRPMLPAVAGMLDMPFLRFLAISLLAGAGWAIAYLTPGWATGAAMRLPLPEGFWSEAAWVGVGAAVLLGACVHASLTAKRHSTPLASALTIALLVALLIGWPHLDRFDQGLMQVAQSLRSPGSDTLMVLVTRLGDFRTQLVAGVLLWLLLLLGRQWRAAFFAGTALLGTALGNAGLKWLFERARPEVLLEPLSSYSFPSGHSSAAFAFFLVLGVLAGRDEPPRWRVTWLLLASIPAAAIALSRVYLGVHWPSDILAGALLAASICGLSLLLTQWVEPLERLPARLWWLILPSLTALLGAAATWALTDALHLYRYAPPV